MQAAGDPAHGADRASTLGAASGNHQRHQIPVQLSQAASAGAYLRQRHARRQLRHQLACLQHAGRDQVLHPPQMTRHGALAEAADYARSVLIGQAHAGVGLPFQQLQQVQHQVQPDVAFRDHEPRQDALGVLLALPPRLMTDQRHDQQSVVPAIRTAHHALAPRVDARLMDTPAQQAWVQRGGAGHRRQICLYVETCKVRMCQFPWWGSPCTGQKYRRWPLSLFLVSGTASGRTYPIPAGGIVQNQELSLGGQHHGSGSSWDTR